MIQRLVIVGLALVSVGTTGCIMRVDAEVAEFSPRQVVAVDGKIYVVDVKDYSVRRVEWPTSPTTENKDQSDEETSEVFAKSK